MFSEIEEEYRKDVQERRYLSYYIRRAIPITILALVLNGLFRQWYIVIYLVTVAILVGLGIVFIVRDLREIDKNTKMVRRRKGIIVKLKSYFEADDTIRVNKLVASLARRNIKTKEDLEITIDYFKSRLPINTKPNLLDWVLTTVLTVASVAIVAYDETTSTVNIQRFTNVFISALIVAMLCFTPVLIFKVVRYLMSRFRNRVDTTLVEDLVYIYINFEKYRVELEAKKG